VTSASSQQRDSKTDIYTDNNCASLTINCKTTCELQGQIQDVRIMGGGQGEGEVRRTGARQHVQTSLSSKTRHTVKYLIMSDD